MKKLLMFLLLGLFLISFTSAIDFDNYAKYEENDMNVKIKDSYFIIDQLVNWGTDIGTIKLTSHNEANQIKKVIEGEDRVVMIYDFYDWEEYKNGIGEIEIINMENGEKEDKSYWIAEVIYEYYEIPIYDTICEKVIDLNESVYDECEEKISTTNYYKRIKELIPYPSKDIPKRNITLALITDVNSGDYKDAVWKIAGVKLNKHAQWEASFNNGIKGYYQLNDTSGTNAVEFFNGTNNLTLTGSHWITGGFIGGGYSPDFDESADTGFDLNGCSEVAIKVDINYTGTQDEVIMERGGVAANGDINILAAGGTRVRIRDSVALVGNSALGIPTDGEYHELFSIINNSHLNIFIDGSLNTTFALNNFVISDADNLFLFSDGSGTQNLRGTQTDEIGIWCDVSFTATEISNFWNGGFGITPPVIDLTPTVTITFPTDGSAHNTLTLDFNATATSDGVLESCWNSKNKGETNSSEVPFGNNFSLTGGEGSNHWTYYCNTTTGELGNSTTTFTIDSIAPAVNIITPINSSNETSLTVQVNTTMIDINLESCWYSNDTWVTNNTFTCGTNLTGDWEEGINVINFAANDSAGNLNNSESVSFTIDSISPNVTINFPTNSSNFTSPSIPINTTIQDVNLQACWFSNDTGTTNNTFTCGTNISADWEEGFNTVYIFANDSFGKLNNSESVSFTIDTTLPVINITSPFDGSTNTTDFTDSNNLTITFRWFVNDSNIETCRVWNGTGNTVVTCGDNSTIIIVDFGNYVFNFTANDTFGNSISQETNVTYDFKIRENNQTFANTTIEGNTEDFSANITLGNGLSISSFLLFYNTQQITGSQSIEGLDNILIKEDFVIPNIDNSVNFTFNWQVTLSDSSVINLTQHNQTVNNLSIDNCDVNTNKIYNFTVVEEETQVLLGNVTIETFIIVFDSLRTTHIINTSFNATTNPIEICLNINLSEGTGYSLDTIVRYQADGYANEYYNIVDFSFTNSTSVQEIILYDLNLTDSTDFKITFKGEDFSPVEDALIFIDRQYISEGIFKTVELPKTDSNGQTIGHFVRNDIVYNIIVVKNGTTLGSFRNIRAFCDDFTIGNCQIQLEATSRNISFFNYDEQVGIIFDSAPTFNNNTNIMSFSFTTQTGEAETVSMFVERSDIFGNRSICNQTITSSSGTLFCNVGTGGDSLFNVKVFSEGSQVGNFNIDSSGFDYGSIGFVAVFIITFLFILILGNDKTSILFGLVLSYISAVALGIIKGGIMGIGSAGVWLIVITILGIWKLNKDNLQ